MKTLKGKKIISTRPISTYDGITSYLIERGAEIINFPMIEISENPLKIDELNILNYLNQFNWIIFTSQNGVKFFFQLIEKLKLNQKIKFAVIGNKTASELQNQGFNPNYISKGNTSELFIQELNDGIIDSNDSVLLALGDIAGTVLEDGLISKSNTKRINVYKTKFVENYSQEIANQIQANQYDIIIFTSPSGVNRFSEIIQNRNIKAASIGKTTEKSLLKHNIKPQITATKSDSEIFAKEIENYLLKN